MVGTGIRWSPYDNSVSACGSGKDVSPHSFLHQIFSFELSVFIVTWLSPVYA